MAFTEDNYTEAIGITGDLTVDNIKIDGTYIGHTDDTDLLSLAAGALTVNGSITSTGLTVNTSGSITLGDASSEVTTPGGITCSNGLLVSTGKIQLGAGDGDSESKIGVPNNHNLIQLANTVVTLTAPISFATANTNTIEFHSRSSNAGGTGNVNFKPTSGDDSIDQDGWIAVKLNSGTDAGTVYIPYFVDTIGGSG